MNPQPNLAFPILFKRPEVLIGCGALMMAPYVVGVPRIIGLTELMEALLISACIPQIMGYAPQSLAPLIWRYLLIVSPVPILKLIANLSGVSLAPQDLWEAVPAVFLILIAVCLKCVLIAQYGYLLAKCAAREAQDEKAFRRPVRVMGPFFDLLFKMIVLSVFGTAFILFSSGLDTPFNILVFIILSACIAVLTAFIFANRMVLSYQNAVIEKTF